MRGLGSRPPTGADRLLVGAIAGLTRLCEHVPIDRALAVAAGIGRLWVGLRGPRTRRVRAALSRALPERTDAERARIERAVFVQLAQGLAELLLLRGRQREALLARVEVVGLERLEAVRAGSGGGVLIVSAHLGNWELACARAAALGIPLSIVYRPQRSAAIDRLLAELRLRSGREPGGVPVELIPRGRAGLAAVRALRRGRAVLVLLDQDARREEGEFVTFFGRPACTRSAPIALAALRGVPVVTAFSRRLPDGRCHRLELGGALPLEPGAEEDPEILRRNVQRATDAIEAAIRVDPGQWIWTHRRWRTQPRVDGPNARSDRPTPGPTEPPPEPPSPARSDRARAPAGDPK
ncbi:MAG: lysophospholipid acyltransferase family protein [Myxococcota bacterium]